MTTVVTAEPSVGKSESAPRISTTRAAALRLRAADHASPADRALVQRILREYFATTGGDDADARYRWLYLANPHGIARTYVAIEIASGEAVAITSLFPRRVRVGAREAMGAIGGDAFVTPRFRRRGLATQLHRLAHADLGTALSFMFGPPEPHNLKALLQAGAKLVGSVRRYTRPLRVAGLGMRLGALAPLSRLVAPLLSAAESRFTVEPMRAPFDARIDRVFRNVVEEGAGRSFHGVLPVRDAGFYAWRFGETAPGRQRGFVVMDGTTPVGTAALERFGRRAAIVDVTCAPGAFRGVVHALVHACKDADAVDLQIHVPSPRKEAELASLGFIPRVTKPFQVQSKDDYVDHAAITSPRAWHYTWGDGDVDHVL